MEAKRPTALVLQPPIFLDERFIDYPPLMPYATAVAAAELRRLGFEVATLDAGCLPGAVFERVATGWRWGVTPAAYSAALTSLGDSLAEAPKIAVVAQSVFQYTAANHPVIASVIRALRERADTTSVVLADQSPGGMHRLDIPTETRQGWLPPFDFLASFESDGALAEIAERVAAGEGRRKAGEAPIEVRGYVADLRETDDPAFDLVDLDAYQDALASSLRNRDWLYTRPGRSVPFLTSRGCPFRCNFCFPEAAWRSGARVGGFRAYPLERVEGQLADLADRGVRHLVIMDATINGDPRRFEGILDLLDRFDMTVDIPNGMRADLLSDAHVARLVGRLSELSISAESGDPEVVARIVGKRLDLENIDRVAKRCHEVGQPLSIHWMVGQPTETPETVNRTLDRAWRLYERYGATPLVQFATPFPGTRLYREAIENGWIPDDPEAIPALPAHTGRTAVLRPPEMEVDTIEAMHGRFTSRWESHRAPRLAVHNTSACTNDCVMCRVSANERPPAPDEAAVRDALGEAAAAGMTEVVFTGGEPSLDRALVRHVRHARQLGFSEVVLETNGRLLAHRPNIERLVRAGLTEVAVSIQGPTPAVHDVITRESGSFAQSIEGLRHALELSALTARRPSGPLRTRVQTVVLPENVGHLDTIARRLRERRVSHWTLQLARREGRGLHRELLDVHLVAEALVPLLEAHAGQLEMCVEGVPPCLLGAHAERARMPEGSRRREVGDRIPTPDASLVTRIAACAACAFRPVCDGMPVESPGRGQQDLDRVSQSG